MTAALRRHWPAIAIGLLALAASWTSLGNGYAYDDGAIVAANPRIRTLAAIPSLFADSYWGASVAAGGYRPLTLALFSVQWAIGGGRPIAFHAANVVLYVALSLAVLALARQSFATMTRDGGAGATASSPASAAAWIAAALFAVHPVHVEAVGNVVGQAELVVALACVWATLLYVRERSRTRMGWRTTCAVLALFAVALLAKEHGVVLPLLLLAAELTIVRDARPLRTRFVAARPLVLGLVMLGLLYLWLRASVLGSVGGMPPHVAYVGLRMTDAHRVLTMIGLAKEWARLLLWPARLVAEYSPPMTPFAVELSAAQLPGFLVMTGTFVLFWIAARQRWRDIVFGLAWTIAAMMPISGILFATGFILAERTLMLPSVGAMLVVAGIGLKAWHTLTVRAQLPRRARLALGGALAAVLVAGVSKSMVRQIVWRDSETLFVHTVQDAPDSYRAHQVFAVWLFAKGYMSDGEREMRRAIELFPYDPIPPYYLAEEYRKRGACDRALPLYRWSLATTDTAQGFALRPYVRCLIQEGQHEEARVQALKGIARGEDVTGFRRLLARADSGRRAGTAGPLRARPVPRPVAGSAAGQSATPLAKSRPGARGTRAQSRL